MIARRCQKEGSSIVLTIKRGRSDSLDADAQEMMKQDVTDYIAGMSKDELWNFGSYGTPDMMLAAKKQTTYNMAPVIVDIVKHFKLWVILLKLFAVARCETYSSKQS